MFDPAEPPPDPRIAAARVLDSVTAGLWPTLSTEDRRERALRAFGLEPVSPWGDRMLYIEARPKG